MNWSHTLILTPPPSPHRLMAEKINKNERKNESDIGTFHQGEESPEFWTLIGVAEDEEPPAEDEIEVGEVAMARGGYGG